MEREIPVIYKRKEECCGCTACYAICPKEAISMVEDEEGFEYPQIDESKCVRCYQCIKVCPIKEHEHSKEKLIGNENSMCYYYRMAYEVVVRIALWMVGKKR